MLPVAAPILIIACSTSQVVMPVASSEPYMSGARLASLNPRNASDRKSTTTAAQAIKPSPSPRMAKIESVYGNGKKHCGGKTSYDNGGTHVVLQQHQS